MIINFNGDCVRNITKIISENVWDSLYTLWNVWNCAMWKMYMENCVKVLVSFKCIIFFRSSSHKLWIYFARMVYAQFSIFGFFNVSTKIFMRRRDTSSIFFFFGNHLVIRIFFIQFLTDLRKILTVFNGFWLFPREIQFFFMMSAYIVFIDQYHFGKSIKKCYCCSDIAPIILFAVKYILYIISVISKLKFLKRL